MITYFESSALVKLTLPDEEGRTIAQELWDQAGAIVVSRVSHPEVRAAVAAAHRAGRVSRHVLRTSSGWIERVMDDSLVVELDASLAREAGDLAQRHRLRGFDALHLASALRASDGATTVATWDQELGSAARSEGLLVVPAPPS